MAYEGETEPDLEAEVREALWVKVGRLQQTIDYFHERGVTDAVMAGGLTKDNLFANFDPDERALALVARMSDLSDDGILRALAEEYEAEGIRIRPSTMYTPELLAPAGVLSRRAPTDEERADVEFGWRIAKALGDLDVGQCVVVRKLTVLALEAIEGSDETIRRGGRLGRENTVVVKVCKPQQDQRFDLPSVGRGTIEVMDEVKASVLAVEAGRTLMFDREDMLAAADRLGMAVMALERD